MIFREKISDIYPENQWFFSLFSLIFFRRSADFWLKNQWYVYKTKQESAVKTACFFLKTCWFCSEKLPSFDFDLIENRPKTSDVFAWNIGRFYSKHRMFFLSFAVLFVTIMSLKSLNFRREQHPFFFCVILRALNFQRLL